MIFWDLHGKKKYKWLAGGIFSLLLLAVIFLPTHLNRHFYISMVSSQIRQLPVYQVERDDKTIAISFDATWGAERTKPILDILDQHQIKTTFFLVNIWMDDYADLTREIAARGHEIQLHSTSHPHFNSLNKNQILAELQDNAAKIQALTNQNPTLFRPPFGEYNNQLIQTASELGLQTIQWSIDSLDWKNLSAQQIEDRVMAKMQPGAIVLFHNDGQNTPAALERILSRLTAEGYSIVPVSELLLPKENSYIDFNGVQRCQN